jgi:hypothetical protein
MAGHSPYLVNKWLDAVFNATSFSVTTLYISAHTGDPGTTGANESALARINVTASFAAAASSSVASNADIEWTNISTAGTYTHIGLWDASTSGNFLCGGALSPTQTLNIGDTLKIASGNLTDAVS